MAEMDIGQSIFEYGQTYVALSRIRSLDGLYLSAFNSKKISANPKVIAFYHEISKNNIHIQESHTDISNNKGDIHELKEDTYETNNVKIIKL